MAVYVHIVIVKAHLFQYTINKERYLTIILVHFAAVELFVFPQDLKEYPLTKAPCRTSLSSKQAPIKNKNPNKDVSQSYKSEVDKNSSSTTAPLQGQDTQTVQKDAESLRAGKG